MRITEEVTHEIVRAQPFGESCYLNILMRSEAEAEVMHLVCCVWCSCCQVAEVKWCF